MFARTLTRTVLNTTLACTKSSLVVRSFSLKFAKSHEYISVKGDIGVVGITDHAAGALGDVVFVELPSVGKKFKAGDTFASVESVKAASDVYTPVSGEIIEINNTIVTAPGTVNESPYEKGWFIKIKVSSLPLFLMYIIYI